MPDFCSDTPPLSSIHGQIFDVEPQSKVYVCVWMVVVVLAVVVVEGGGGLKGLEAKAEKTRLIPLPIQPCFLL